MFSTRIPCAAPAWCLGATIMLAAPAWAGDPIGIGAVLPFSGPATSWGINLAGAVEILADQINASGGLAVNGDKHLIKVTRYDDKYAANEAVAAMNRLIYKDGIKYVLSLGSASTIAMTPLATENQVLILTSAFSARTMQNDAPYTFRYIMPSSEFAFPQIKWVAEKLQIKRAGALAPNDETGQTLAQDLTKSYAENGVKMDVEFFERDRVDFVPLLTRLMAAGVKGIDLSGNSPATAGLIVKQAREAGFTGPIINTGGESTRDIINVAGNAAEGLYVHLPADVTSPEIKGLAEKFQAKYGIPMNAPAAAQYAAAQMLFKAIQKAGKISDIPAVAKALESLAGDNTVLGPISFVGGNQQSGAVYGNGHQMMYPFYIGQVKDGTITIAATCTPQSCK